MQKGDLQNAPAWLSRSQDGGLLFKIYVQPRSSKNSIAGVHGDAVKLCITAPPVDNKANSAVQKYLAQFFGVAKSAVQIKSGKQSRSKQVHIADTTLEEALRALLPVL